MEVNVDESNGRVGKLIAEPLERGFGQTLGNALRRVLLSSIRGAAVTSVKFDQVLHEFSSIPGVAEDVVEIRRGRKVNTEKRFFPGYVLIKMELTDEAFHLVKSTPKVSGFLGSDHGTKPHPVSQSEIDRITNRVQEGIDNPKPSIVFEIGEQVRVSEGPFASFSGFVEEIDEEKTRLKVAVSIFGRPTPVELQYGQVEKL